MTKQSLFTLIAFLIASQIAMAGAIILEGNYQGKNIYVQNPFAETGVGFCVYEVKVNGEVTTDEINSSAFEIDLSNFQLEISEKVTVSIRHKDDCRPKVLNPEVLKPKSTFEIIDMDVTKDGILKWSTKGETGKLPYIVEQFKWSKWINIGEVEGKGTPEVNEYAFKITPHSGENLFRVKQVDYTNKPRYSKSERYREMTLQEVTFAPVKVSKEITFSHETAYEIYDSYGNIVKRGTGEKVDCFNLRRGIYYLSFDNKTERFSKK